MKPWAPGKPAGFGAPGIGGFVPYRNDRPAPGYYDVSLDQQGRAATRGLAQTLQDLGTAGSRAETQLGLDKESLDLRQGRGIADLQTSDTRNGQDFATSLQNIARGFSRQADGQRQAASAAGLAGPGGALLAAARARATNQGIAEQPVRQSFERATQDNALQRGRLGEDTTRARTELERQFGMGAADRGQTGQRATDENTFFQQDIGAQRFQQAGQMGYVAPPKPRNEFTDPQGNPYRVIRQGKRTVAVNSLGKQIWSRARGAR